jgi:murein DD-endopeptidase MepM/ murein hydrolase activator NlpD
MQLIITDAWLAKSRAIHLSGSKLFLAVLVASFALTAAAAGLYHLVFLKAAREGWPVIGSMVGLVVQDDVLQRERYMRENLDAMARKLGEMQAKVLQMEALGERVSGLAGINPNDIKTNPGRGGVLVSGRPLSLEELQTTLTELDQLADQRGDLLTVIESRLFDQKIRKSMVPTQAPVRDAYMGSAFGWRIDPFTGRTALHTGMDFQADTGTPILSAAGGVVVAQEYHPAYGKMVEVDHGNDLVTRYAHASKVNVKKGDLVKRGQKLGEVGSTGRSTGPHLHFEVLIDGVPQNPQKFLAAGEKLADTLVAKAELPAKPAQRPAVRMDRSRAAAQR